MFPPGRNGMGLGYKCQAELRLKVHRTAEQAEGGKVVGVDPTVITACEFGLSIGWWLSLTY
jgi:hypothetical protein